MLQFGWQALSLAGCKNICHPDGLRHISTKYGSLWLFMTCIAAECVAHLRAAAEPAISLAAHARRVLFPLQASAWPAPITASGLF